MVEVVEVATLPEVLAQVLRQQAVQAVVADETAKVERQVPLVRGEMAVVLLA
jgi:hypothetical protein